MMRLIVGVLAGFLALSACDAPPSPPVAVAGVSMGQDGRTGDAKGSQGIQFLGGNGSSLDQAMLIHGARGEADGVPSEYDWLAANRPGWRVTSQELILQGSRKFDVLHIAKGSQKADIYFDITEYFGKR